MKIPHTIAIFTKLECDPDFSYTKKAIQTLVNCGFDVLINQNVKYRLGDLRDSVHLIYNERELIENADMAVVLGGDGTMLDFCVHTSELARPVVGINLGHLGFLTAVERDEIEQLSALASGDFFIEKRMMLDVEIVTKFTTYKERVLNEVVVASGACSRMAEFELFAGGAKHLGYRGDGLIIATPTGSTAYSLSAGGPVIDPAACIITVTPICPHTLLRAPVIFSPETELTVSGHTRDEQPDIRVTFDGKNSTLVACESKIIIRKSPDTSNIVKIGENRFYDILESKLNKR